MEHCLDYLEKLVSFDTVSGTAPEKDSPNRPLIEWMAAEAASWGAGTTIFDVAPGKACLYVRLGGRAERFEGLLLTGHSDTVNCNAERWTSDPWTLTRRNGRVYGLGSCDMKGFLAVAMALMREKAREGEGLGKGLALLVTCDEETSMQGARHCVPLLRAAGAAPGLIVVGEPTGMTPIFGHKGFMGRRVVIRGEGAHSSDPTKGVNAIKTAARWVSEMNALEKAMQSFRDPEFEAPGTPGVPYPTLNLGTIRGGDSVNRVCAEVSVTCDVRPMPAWDAQKAQQALEEVVSRVNAVGEGVAAVESLYPDIPPFGNRHAAVREAVEAATGATGAFVSYCTEAGFMEALGPTVVLGPGSINQAHGVDEFTELAQFERAAKVLRTLCRQFAV